MKAAALLTTTFCCALWAAPAVAAGASRTFVSGAGNDSNPCTITAPCRSLQAAVNVTAPAGEVVILTPGGYGEVTISHSITIANDGVGTASISLPASDVGITINAASTDSVQLRGLEIDGNLAGGGNIGIEAYTVGSLSIVNCVVRHAAFGLYLSAGTTNVFNSIVSDQGPANPSNPNDLSATGIAVQSGATVYVTNSLLNGNGSDGILTAGGTAYADHDTITGNRVGLNNSGGTLYSFGDNNISGNTGGNTSGTVTPVTPQ